MPLFSHACCLDAHVTSTRRNQNAGRADIGAKREVIWKMRAAKRTREGGRDKVVRGGGGVLF